MTVCRSPSATPRVRRRRVSATSRAREMSATTANFSPAVGTASRPETSTGVDGPASAIERPLSSNRARTRPNPSPQTITSPTFSVPSWTSTVATTPRPSEIDDSRQVPVAGRAGLAFSLSAPQLGDDPEHLEQLGDPLAGEGRGLDDRRVAAVFLRGQVLLRQLAVDLVEVDVGQVDLVQGDDDRDVGRLGVRDGLLGLGHHAVVGRDDQDDDVGDVGPAGPHGGERLVARRVDEGDRLARRARPGRRRCAG